MPHTVDVYWSFRSPYSYLATPRIAALAEEYKIDFRIKPVYPIAVRIKNFFKQVNPLWPPYLIRDTYRISQQLGVPYGWPRPDPIKMDIATGEVPEDQPHIYRLTQLGQAAVEANKGLAFIHEIANVIWSGKVENWHEGDHLAKAAERAGLDLAKLDATVAQDRDRLHGIIEENQKALIAAGHWGVPTFVFEGEAFFGQDRIELLLWRLRQHGLKHRDNKPVTAEFLTGSWALDRWELWRDGQFARLPLGDHGSGSLLYHPNGRMAAFLQHANWPKAGAADRPGTEDMLAYDGAWRIEGREVVHKVAHASHGPFVGQELRRAARRTSSDGLELIAPDAKDSKGRTMSNILRWRRV
jgi:2-hydroxychromene-2-carboxylate isomerase